MIRRLLRALLVLLGARRIGREARPVVTVSGPDTWKSPTEGEPL